MQFSYGGIFFDDNSVTVNSCSARTIYSERRHPLLLRKTMACSGEIIADGPANLAIKAAAVRATLALDGGDVILHSTTGVIAILNAGSFTGVQVIDRPTFFAQDGYAHWATSVPYRMAFEADYPAATDGIVSYNESITTTGNDGGSRQVCLELDIGPPVIQTVSEATPIVIVQTGEINGFLGYATINDPIFPNAILAPEDKQITEIAPLLYGNTYTNFNRRWTYRMTLANPTSVPSPLRR